MEQVESDSHGKVRMGPGTLYGSIRCMLDAELDSRAMAVVAMNGIFVALFSGSGLLFGLTAKHFD